MDRELRDPLKGMTQEDEQARVSPLSHAQQSVHTVIV